MAFVRCFVFNERSRCSLIGTAVVTLSILMCHQGREEGDENTNDCDHKSGTVDIRLISRRCVGEDVRSGKYTRISSLNDVYCESSWCLKVK